MSVYVNTAWRTQSDWDRVFDQLYSGSPEDIRAGLDSIACWEARFPVPVGVEVTAELLHAKLTSFLGENSDGDSFSSHTLQRIYSIALIRFVNAISDLHQTHLTPRSIKNILLSLRIPVWICDQRHDATHHAIPCLSLLESGVEFCFDWIKSYYWEESQSCVPNSRISKEDFDAKFSQFFGKATKQFTGFNRTQFYYLKNRIVNLVKKSPDVDILSVSILDAVPASLLYQNTSLPVASLPRLHSNLSQLNAFWSKLLLTLDTICSKKLSVYLVTLILKRDSSLRVDKTHRLYHGLWLRLALNHLTVIPQRRRLTRRAEINSRKKKMFQFCTYLTQLALSYPGAYTHAVMKFLIRRCPLILRGKQAVNLLKITKWISLTRRRDYQSLKSIYKELPEIVSCQQRLVSKVRVAKNVTWKQLNAHKHVSIPIGACIS